LAFDLAANCKAPLFYYHMNNLRVSFAIFMPTLTKICENRYLKGFRPLEPVKGKEG
jgi:hypothetical protein